MVVVVVVWYQQSTVVETWLVVPVSGMVPLPILSLLREESRVEDCAQIETDIGEGCRKARAAPPMSAKYP